eukprot:g4568.t1
MSRSRGNSFDASGRRSGASTPKPSSKYMFVVSLPVPGTGKTHEVQVKATDTAESVVSGYISHFKIKAEKEQVESMTKKVSVMMTKAYVHREEQYKSREKELKVLARVAREENKQLRGQLEEV